MKPSLFYAHVLTAANQQRCDVEEILDVVTALGYRGVDLSWEQLSNEPKGLTSRLKHAGFQIASIYKFCKFNEAFDRDEIKSFMESVAESGSQKAMIIPGFYRQNCNREIELASMTEALSQTCKIAHDYEVTVTLEDYDDPLSPCSNLPDFLRFFHNVPQLKCTLDTGNFIFDQSNLLTDVYPSLRDRIVHVHLKDRSKTPLTVGDTAFFEEGQNAVYSAPVGAGYIPIQECLSLLHADSYDGFLTVEHFGAADQLDYIKRSVQWLNKTLMTF